MAEDGCGVVVGAKCYELSRLQIGESTAKFGDCFAYRQAHAQQGKSNEGETKWPRKPWRRQRRSKQRSRWHWATSRADSASSLIRSAPKRTTRP